ncbi:MAG: methionyl-tRNA formyltransferase [Acidimicrobiia bacterium]
MGAIFLGTPAAAVPSLCALAQVADIELVVTQPDKPGKRSRMGIPPPVKTAAHQFGFPVAQPATSAELDAVITRSMATFGLVVAYGRILTEGVLSRLPMGFLNVHFSLLPRWRGAAPVERAIAAGDETTGVTLMRIDEGLDTGPVLAERATDIAPDETGGTLTARLAYLGARLVDDAVPDYLRGRRLPVPQIDTGTTHAARLSRDEARLVSSTGVVEAERSIRAFNPRPGAWIVTDAGEIKIHRASITDRPAHLPGSIRMVDAAPVLALADGGLRLVRVQPQGKESMDGADWMHGRRVDQLTVIDR